jgi:hypothetical protein
VPTRAPQQSQQARVRRPQQRHQTKELKLKSGHSEDSLHSESTHDPAKAAAEETGAHSMEALAHALAHAEQDGAKESKEAHAEAREQAEREEKPSGFFARMFAPKSAQKQQGKPQQTPGKPQQAQQQPLKKSIRDGFEKSDPRAMPLNSASYNALKPVGTPVSAAAIQQNKLTGSFARLDRPPDAFALLREAKDRGVLFKEDWDREGHSEDQDDPELAAAVEEVISRLFGKAGILRVGPGRNDKDEPVVVVVATHGFSEASLAAIPERVGRFFTLLALSFELLPLRRER